MRFDHIEGFGKVSDLDFIYSAPYGVLEPGESGADALKKGWIPWGDAWYNLRSVRLEVSQYRATETVRKLSRKVGIQPGDLALNQQGYMKLYEQYCKYHGFARDIQWEYFEGCKCIEYWHDDKLAGVSFYKLYEDQFVAMQFIWNYEHPKLSLGNIAQMHECDLAKSMGCTHVYLLGGYEKCCRYKAGFRGFEFWTGSEWSTDIDLYYKLVERDEQIQVVLS